MRGANASHVAPFFFRAALGSADSRSLRTASLIARPYARDAPSRATTSPSLESSSLEETCTRRRFVPAIIQVGTKTTESTSATPMQARAPGDSGAQECSLPLSTGPLSAEPARSVSAMFVRARAAALMTHERQPAAATSTHRARTPMRAHTARRVSMLRGEGRNSREVVRGPLRSGPCPFPFSRDCRPVSRVQRGLPCTALLDRNENTTFLRR